MSLSEVKPIKTFEDLLKWNGACNDLDKILDNILDYSCCNYYKTDHPKTLVCHDMKGGYTDDRYCNGCDDKDAYRFYNWSGVDGFIYFSHSFVTIPPVGWVQAAHLHNVKVFGTLITEWDDGASLCLKLLQDSSTINNAVTQLVNIAKAHKFEGWLVNIENKILPEHVERLLEFVTLLTKKMHEAIKGAEVIWYDSVTCEGDLKWQNKLNQLNKCFFNVCDGIFINYTWTADDLNESKETAGDRSLDVYVGLDVFGRNFYEGGGFNTFKALEVVRRCELSAAIFAQGWTYEVLGIDNFIDNELKLWKSLTPFLYCRGPTKLPFKTNFCQGYGDKLYKNGEEAVSTCWYNLSHQQYQPLWCESKDTLNMKTTSTTSFNGGSCMLIESTIDGSMRLFMCDLSWQFGLNVSLTYKCISNPCNFSMVLKDDKRSEYVLYFEHTNEDLDLAKNKLTTLTHSNISTNWKNGWKTKEFHIRGKGSAITEIILNLSPSQLYIGQISLENAINT